MGPNTDALEEITARVARLEEQRRAAEAEAERAAGRLEELDARRDALAPGGSGGETAGELATLAAALNEEIATASRTRTVAEDAARELDRLVLEAQVRRREEEKRLAWERYEALCRERYSLDEEAERVMADLVGVLDRLEGLRAEQVRAAEAAERAYLAQQDPGTTAENWLARRLRRWLPDGSMERYDAPLPELDPLAQEPGSGGGARGGGPA